MIRKRIFYFCRRGLGTHLQFYTGWVLNANRKGLPIKLLTTVSFKEYFNIPQYLKRKEFIFLPCFKRFDKIVSCLYFIFQFVKNNTTIIQLRKRDSFIFEKLKRFFNRKFKYVIEKEGDVESEYNYLEHHPYKENFYDYILDDKENVFKRDKREILKADHVICVSEKLKNYYISKYSLNKNHFTALTTGCDSTKFRFNKIIRKKYREKLGLNSDFTVIYVGNVYYSWQNISKTLHYYKMIKEKIKKTKIIIITREVDKPIILGFLNKHKINSSEVILKYSIPNDQIQNYLNAADLGVILREDHPMNHYAAPGKFGEYACCGLSILTGKNIANFSEKLSKTHYGIVLDNIYDDVEFSIKFIKFMEYNNKLDRKEISEWGMKNFSFNAFIDKYVNLCKGLMKE